MCMLQNIVETWFYFGVVDLVCMLTFSIEMTHPPQKINKQAAEFVCYSVCNAQKEAQSETEKNEECRTKGDLSPQSSSK